MKAESDVADVSNGMSVSQESERSTSRLKREQYCIMLADKLMNGRVIEAVTHIKNTCLNDDQKLDTTLSRYTNFFEEKQQQPLQHENIHNLFFGDKNDIRQLIEIEGKKKKRKCRDPYLDTCFL